MGSPEHDAWWVLGVGHQVVAAWNSATTHLCVSNSKIGVEKYPPKMDGVKFHGEKTYFLMG